MKKLKGTAYIELIDEKTGEVESVKEDNMLTNALNHMFNDGIFNHCSYYSNNQSYGGYTSAAWHWDTNFFTPLIKNTIGGILLFSDNIPEDPEQIYAPAEARCIGYASIDGYNNTNTFRGSFNPTESGTLTDGNGYKFVWNFTTAQGNGEIKCLGLTTPFGGRFGYGMSLDTKQRETMSTVCWSNIDKTTSNSNWFRVGSFYSPGVILRKNGSATSRYQAINKNIGWDCYFTGNDFKTFRIQKKNASTTELTLTGKTPSNQPNIETTDITISIFMDNAPKIYHWPYTMSDWNSNWSSCQTNFKNDITNIHIQYEFDFEDNTNENGYLYLIANSKYYGYYKDVLGTSANASSQYSITGKKIYCVKIDLDNYNLIYEKEIDLDNFRVACCGPDTSTMKSACVRNNYLYLTEYYGNLGSWYSGSGYKILKINLETNEQTIINLPKYTNNSYNFNTNLFRQSMMKIKGRIIIPTGYILDANDEVLYYPLISSADSSSNTSVYSIPNGYIRSSDPVNNMLTFAYSGGSNNSNYNPEGYGVSFYTPCLFTINNLTTPITKTQDKAMKITYILREEE